MFRCVPSFGHVLFKVPDAHHPQIDPCRPISDADRRLARWLKHVTNGWFACLLICGAFRPFVFIRDEIYMRVALGPLWTKHNLEEAEYDDVRIEVRLQTSTLLHPQTSHNSPLRFCPAQLSSLPTKRFHSAIHSCSLLFLNSCMLFIVCALDACAIFSKYDLPKFVHFYS